MYNVLEKNHHLNDSSECHILSIYSPVENLSVWYHGNIVCSNLVLHGKEAKDLSTLAGKKSDETVTKYGQHLETNGWTWPFAYFDILVLQATGIQNPIHKPERERERERR